MLLSEHSQERGQDHGGKHQDDDADSEPNRASDRTPSERLGLGLPAVVVAAHGAFLTPPGRRSWHKVEEPRGQLPRAALHATTRPVGVDEPADDTVGIVAEEFSGVGKKTATPTVHAAAKGGRMPLRCRLDTCLCWLRLLLTGRLHFLLSALRPVYLRLQSLRNTTLTPGRPPSR